MKAIYPALIYKSAKSDYSIGFPDVPGCVGTGKDLALAIKSASGALTLHLKTLDDLGQTIPKPRPLDEVDMVATSAQGVTVVECVLPSRSAKFTVSLPVDLVEEIDARSSNRSGFLAHAARRELDRLSA